MSGILLFIAALVLLFCLYALGLRFIYRTYRRDLADDRAFWAAVDTGRAEALRIWKDLPDGALKDGVLLGIQRTMEIEKEVKDE